jgi:hypothetical protein
MVSYSAYQVDQADDAVNGRDKVICVNKLEANEVEKKVRLVPLFINGNLR